MRSLLNQLKVFGKWPKSLVNMSYCHKRYFAARKSEDTFRDVFDRRVKEMQKQRAISSSDADVFEYLKDEVACMLADRIADVKRAFPLALDLGCGRGFLSKHITSQDGIDTIIQGDICRDGLVKVHACDVPSDSVVFDEERQPFRDNSFDLILTSLSLHWVNDLTGYFKQVLKVLKPDGCFMGVMFGSDTLFELRCSLQLAESEREGGIAPHVSPMMQGHQLANLLSGAGFNLVTLDFDQLIVNYPSIFELMEDLQGMGENSALFKRKMLHRDTLMAAAAIYQAMYGNSEDYSIPATYQLLFMIGWKPHGSQQKPLERGAVPKGFNKKDDKS